MGAWWKGPASLLPSSGVMLLGSKPGRRLAQHSQPTEVPLHQPSVSSVSNQKYPQEEGGRVPGAPGGPRGRRLTAVRTQGKRPLLVRELAVVDISLPAFLSSPPPCNLVLTRSCLHALLRPHPQARGWATELSAGVSDQSSVTWLFEVRVLERDDWRTFVACSAAELVP